MKKFLSLVLALVMTMSLVTISAGAKDFTDDSKIQYEEAVDVVSDLKIVDGYKDGSFNPTGTLTRGAAAKIICNLLLGP
ncbi:S-layer homology domain-containing protein, partial [uncultured Oscillibacter sp.]